MLNLHFQNGTTPPLNARNMNAIVDAINTMQTQLANPFTFKGSVSAVSNLPSSGNTVNDTYYVTAETCLYTWDGNSWEVASLSESDYLEEIANVKNDLADLEQIQLNKTIVLDSDHVRTGYYMTGDGSYNTWTRSLCTKTYAYEASITTLLQISIGDSRYIKGSIYDSFGTYSRTVGEFNSSTGTPTASIRVLLSAGEKLKLSFGVWPVGTDASTYNTDEWLAENIAIKYGYNVGEKIDKENRFRFKPIWEQGNYKTSNGAGEVSDYHIRSPYFVPVDTSCIATVPSGYKFTVLKYYGLSYTTFAGYTKNLTGTVEIDGGYNYKFVLQKIDESAIVPDDASEFVAETEKGVVTIGPSGDVTGLVDREKIQSALHSFRIVNLLPGDYYTGQIIMPNASTIRGSGAGTRIHFVDGQTGSCILIPNRRCTLSDFSLIGSDTDLHFIDLEDDPVEGDRVGVTFTGVSDADPQKKGCIERLWIYNFSGSGIRCYNTGVGSSSGMNISDCYIWNCFAGLNIFRKSEYHRVHGTNITGCFRGCVNNGGNNQFDNCTFSSCGYGMFMDNADGLATNNSHGGMSACILQHNRKRAFYINNMLSGFAITGCNIDNGGFESIDSTRIVVNACNFMDAFSITIDGGSLVLFSACVFRNGTERRVSIENNTAVRFNGCYYTNGNIFDPT